MRYERVHIQAIEYVAPTIEVTTESLERMLGPLYRRLGLSQGLLEALTGVRARRFWPEGTKAHDAGAQAARRVLDRHGVSADRIETVVSTSVCKDYLEPPMASLIAGDLGVADHCRNFDVGHACLGFMSGMLAVANMIELGQIEYGLVIAGEGSREVTAATVRRLLKPGQTFGSFSENLATLTLGSMAVAALLVHERHSQHGHQLLGGASLSATNHSRLCLGTATSMKTDAPTLLREGVSLAGRTWQAAQANLGLRPDEVREFVLHQVGHANHEALMKTLALPSDKVLRLYTDHGNVGAAGVPFTLATAVEQGRVKSGDTAALMGIGSGLNCTMLGVRW
ncbi:MAG: 3-oxoacyl-[acyl-carrier-protein] synthase III [Myxococcota bacterium]|jgi:3-oxoacyl-[acyl-carrier-protein] synthase III